MIYDAHMSPKMEPTLRKFIDWNVVTARTTFAKDTDEQTLRNTMLLLLAGRGFAKLEHTGAGGQWVRTEALMELEKAPNRPFDSATFMSATTTKTDNLLNMTGSLRLFIIDLIAIGKRQHAGWAEANDENIIMLTLAGKGLVSLRTLQNDAWIWHANVPLIDDYSLGGGTRRPKIILDDVLKNIVQGLTK